MIPSATGRLPPDLLPESVTYTFTASAVAEKPDSEVLELLMKSEEFKAFREDLKTLSGFGVEMFKLFSGAVFAVATGVFVGTLSVVKELSAWSFNWMLGLALGLSTFAVIVAFVELLLSQFATDREKQVLEWRLKLHDYATEMPNRYSDWCRYLMVTTCITLGLGVALSVAFVFLNRSAPRRTNESGPPASTKGVADSPIRKADPAPVVSPRPNSSNHANPRGTT